MDPILFWNAEALEANRRDFTRDEPPEQGGPTLSSRALAIVHLAMYDAWFGVRGTKPTYRSPAYSAGMPAPTKPPPPADDAAGVAAGTVAVAAAAHRALSALFPAQRAAFDAALARSGAAVEDPSVRDAAAYGRDAATAVLIARALDPTPGDVYTPNPDRPHHQPDPSPFRRLGFHGAAYGRAVPFATRGDYRLDRPPYRDADYDAAYAQVYAKGGAAHLATTTRVPDETAVGYYWAYDGVRGLGTPPRLYNQVVRAAVEQLLARDPGRSFTTDNYAELFALVNVAMGDAGIFAWREKYRFDFWRPVVGVRHHDPSTGTDAMPGRLPAAPPAAARADPFWEPLGAPSTNARFPPFTPPFPAYPSGHATFGAAAFQVARLYLGNVDLGAHPNGYRDADALAFDFVSGELDGTAADLRPESADPTALPSAAFAYRRTRHHRAFASLWDAIRENGISRVYLGVHWSFDAFAEHDPRYDRMVGGVPLGLKIAEDIFANGLRPIPDPLAPPDGLYDPPAPPAD